MKQGQENGAVLYVRVSTDEQASGPLNLENQEKRCRDYCRQKGLHVVEVFVDPGESGRSAARPEFQRMLPFCKAHRREIRYVVVQDLSRFARDSGDQANAIVELGRSGIVVRSVYEPNVDDTAAGKLAANMLGAFNQYFSDALSEKMKDRTRQAVSAGRFPWRAPIGYQNVGGTVGPNIKPDPKRAPLIRRAFELMATGRFKKSDVLRTVTEEGLTTPKGKPLTKQTFQAILRNPLHAGWVTLPSDPSFEPVKGLHEAIVDQVAFDRVQAILEGRRPTVVAKRKINPVVPLKAFIKCACCGTPLTGGSPQGRGGKKYPRYWCPNSGCLAVKLSKDKLEGEFQDLLRRLRADPETVRDFPRLAVKVWKEKQGDAEREMQHLDSRLEELRKLKSRLVRMRLSGELREDEFEEEKANIEVEKYGVEEQLRVVASTQATADSFLRFAELHLVDMASLWRIADPQQRQRVQNLLFQGGLHYSPEAGILNRSKSSLFSFLEEMKRENGGLVGPPGLEPGANGL